MHHNPNAEGNEGVSNWEEILKDVQKEQINNPIVVFSGHIHYIDNNLRSEGSAAVTGKNKGTYYFSVGSLLNKEYKSRSFNMYEIDNNTITYHFNSHIEAEAEPMWNDYKQESITIEKQEFSSNKKQEPIKNKTVPGENHRITDKEQILKYISCIIGQKKKLWINGTGEYHDLILIIF